MPSSSTSRTRSGSERATELDFTSPAIPGGSFLAAIYDRSFMQLSDRGGASNIVGDRWAELCAVAMATSDQLRCLPQEGECDLQASTVVRLDDIPEVARTASRQQLQNPDFLLVGAAEGRQHVWAADAKFSVDTARSKQVSGDVVSALVGIGPTITNLLPRIEDDAVYDDGVFLCPDYSLTHRLMVDRRGPRRTTVQASEVRLVPVTSDEFLTPLGQEGLRSFLAELDQLPFDPQQSLLVGLHYFRLARTAIGCWQDETAPLLSFRDTPVVDFEAVEHEARTFASGRMSAWGLMLRWNDRADLVRQQRQAVDQATSVPINGKLLREQIETAAAAAKVVAPSASKVRRIVGSWFREQVRESFGPIPPPVDAFSDLLRQLSVFSRDLAPTVGKKTDQVVTELLAEAPPLTPSAD